jgi:hypothetical protein
MTTGQQPKPCAAGPSDEQATLQDVIGKNVLGALGCPADLQRVQVRRLWGDYYRVNVFTGGDPCSVRIAHSYFLAANAEGAIAWSTPDIARVY